MDFTQFFNPSAWGSWSPSSFQGMLAPGVQNSPVAPSPGGVMPNTNMTGTAVLPPAATPSTPAGNIFSSPFLGGSGNGGGTSGSGLGGLFSKGSGANNMMANMGMNFLKPQQIQPPQLQMAHPVGPVQLPGGGGNAPMTGTNTSPFNTNMTGVGNPNPFQQLGMLGGYHF